jgi:hypothetical protein
MLRRLLLTLLGIAAGYAAYIPVLIIVEYATYGRVDSEKAFYALYYPFNAPFLLTASGDELILTLAGTVLIIAGIIVANIRPVRSRFGV